jgi:hypothetical protein
MTPTQTTTEGTDEATEALRAELAPFATEYRFDLAGVTYRITRYDNHDGLLPGDAWAAVCWRGALNTWYLGRDASGGWGWKYKSGAMFKSAVGALVALRGHPFPEGT